MTICQKDGYWKDENASCNDPRNSQYCKQESWSAIGADQMGFALFEPTQFSNSIWDHIGQFFWRLILTKGDSGTVQLNCMFRMG